MGVSSIAWSSFWECGSFWIMPWNLRATIPIIDFICSQTLQRRGVLDLLGMRCTMGSREEFPLPRETIFGAAAELHWCAFILFYYSCLMYRKRTQKRWGCHLNEVLLEARGCEIAGASHRQHKLFPGRHSQPAVWTGPPSLMPPWKTFRAWNTVDGMLLSPSLLVNRSCSG